jgi:hypothetical protein
MGRHGACGKLLGLAPLVDVLWIMAVPAKRIGLLAVSVLGVVSRQRLLLRKF